MGDRFHLKGGRIIMKAGFDVTAIGEVLRALEVLEDTGGYVICQSLQPYPTMATRALYTKLTQLTGFQLFFNGTNLDMINDAREAADILLIAIREATAGYRQRKPKTS
jgi:hypothetical protein